MSYIDEAKMVGHAMGEAIYRTRDHSMMLTVRMPWRFWRGMQYKIRHVPKGGGITVLIPFGNADATIRALNALPGSES